MDETDVEDWFESRHLGCVAACVAVCVAVCIAVCE